MSNLIPNDLLNLSTIRGFITLTAKDHSIRLERGIDCYMIEHKANGVTRGRVLRPPEAKEYLVEELQKREYSLI